MASIKTNILLNSINTVTSLIFPIITFPYAARVLLPEGIGSVNFLNGIINYIVLLTSLGIPMYAVREIAKYRDSPKERGKVTVEILTLSFGLCLLGYIGVFFLAEFIPEIHKQSCLFYILSLTIVFNTVGINWFYQGVEDFKYITIRSLVIRTLSAASLFIFVKSSSDLIAYGCIIVGSSVGSNLWNFFHLRKYVNIQAIDFRSLEITRHIKPSLQVFILNLIVSLYIQLNTVMIGFMAGETEVGYFAAGTKISHIGLAMITSLGTVLLPRCSYLLKKGDTAGFRSVIKKSLNITLALSLPITAGLMILAKPVTLIFCGADYMPAIPVLLLNAPVIIFISLTNLMGIQILYPKNKLSLVIWSVSGGAIMNLLLNVLLIPGYGAVGAAVSTLIAEFTVLVIQIWFGKAYYPFRIRELLNIKYISAVLLMTFVTMVSILPLSSDILKLVVGTAAGASFYFLYLYFTRDSLTMELAASIFKRFKNAK